MANVYKVVLFMLVSLAAFGQGSRYDNFAWTTAPVGNLNVIVPVPGSVIKVCQNPANATPCTNYQNIYTDQALTVLIDQTTTPVTADAQGNWGFWVTPGTYQYTLTIGGNSYGPYSISVGESPSNGAFHVLNEISPYYPAPQAPTTYPLGNDLSPITRGPADLANMQYALEVTATNSVSPGACVFTVANPTLNGVAQTGNPTALFGNPSGDPNLRIIVEPGVPGQGNWESLAYSIVDGNHLSATCAKSHTTPKIRQQGAHLEQGWATIYKADPTGQWTDYSIEDANFSQAFLINLVAGASWPQSAAIKFPSVITGFNNGTRDFVIRNHDSTSRFILLNAANTAQLMRIDDTGNATMGGPLNVSNTIGSVTGDADNTLSLSAGTGGTPRGVSIAFEENGVNKWSTQMSTTINYLVTDVVNSLARLAMTPGGVTSLESAGTSPLRINDVANSGTGGTEFYNGGATPAKVASVSVTGKGTFDGGLDANNAGIANTGAVTGLASIAGTGVSASANHAICWKTATTLGYCSTVVAADGSCTCN